MVCKYCQEQIDSHEHVMRNGKECLKIENNIFSEIPRCAFKGDKYTKDNWACETMLRLRQLSDYHGWNNDESLDVIHTGKESGEFLILTYYKGRGRTGNAYIMYDDAMRELTLDEAYNIIDNRGD